jgi:hypothetical protein
MAKQRTCFYCQFYVATTPKIGECRRWPVQIKYSLTTAKNFWGGIKGGKDKDKENVQLIQTVGWPEIPETNPQCGEFKHATIQVRLK